MEQLYLAHQLGARGVTTVADNLDDAEWYLAALQRANPHIAIVAPWIAEIRLRIGDDAVPADRDLGIARCRETASRCDGIILCGTRISAGMLAELRSTGWGRRAVVHRVSSRTQEMVLPPRHHWMTVARFAPYDAEQIWPSWLEALLIGAAPTLSPALAFGEIHAAVLAEQAGTL